MKNILSRFALAAINLGFNTSSIESSSDQMTIQPSRLSLQSSGKAQLFESNAAIEIASNVLADPGGAARRCSFPLAI